MGWVVGGEKAKDTLFHSSLDPEACEHMDSDMPRDITK